MSRNYVTDPQLLSQLNAAPSAQGESVTDPNLLAQLNASPQGQAPSGLDKITNILNQSAQMAELPAAAIAKFGQDVAAMVTPGLKKSVPQVFGDPYKGLQQITGVPAPTGKGFKEAVSAVEPLVPLAFGPLGVGADIGSQAFTGAAMDPTNRLRGAEYGLGGALAGHAIGGIFNQIGRLGEIIHPQKYAREAVDTIKNMSGGLLRDAKQGFNKFRELGTTKVVDVPAAKNIFGDVFEPQDALRELRLRGAELKNKYPQLAHGLNDENTASRVAISNRFDPRSLNLFNNNFSAGTDANKAFTNFLDDGSALNLDKLKRTLNKEIGRYGKSDSVGRDFEKADILRDIKHDLRENVTIPFLKGHDARAGTDLLGDYLNADKKYALRQNLFGLSKKLDNLAKGNIKTVSPEKLHSILNPLAEDGRLVEGTLPYNIHKQLEERMIRGKKAEALTGGALGGVADLMTGHHGLGVPASMVLGAIAPNLLQHSVGANLAKGLTTLAHQDALRKALQFGSRAAGQYRPFGGQ